MSGTKILSHDEKHVLQAVAERSPGPAPEEGRGLVDGVGEGERSFEPDPYPTSPERLPASYLYELEAKLSEAEDRLMAALDSIDAYDPHVGALHADVQAASMELRHTHHQAYFRAMQRRFGDAHDIPAERQLARLEAGRRAGELPPWPDRNAAAQERLRLWVARRDTVGMPQRLFLRYESRYAELMQIAHGIEQEIGQRRFEALTRHEMIDKRENEHVEAMRRFRAYREAHPNTPACPAPGHPAYPLALAERKASLAVQDVVRREMKRLPPTEHGLSDVDERLRRGQRGIQEALDAWSKFKHAAGNALEVQRARVGSGGPHSTIYLKYLSGMLVRDCARAQRDFYREHEQQRVKDLDRGRGA